MKKISLLLIAILLLTLPCFSLDLALTAPKAESFYKVNSNKSFDVAIGRYQSKEDPDLKVDLIGAIHFGEKKYFASLNEIFKTYDVVLYELVAPKGTIPTKTKNLSLLGQIQNSFADLLALHHQLHEVDYSAKNFIHADASFDDLSEEMKKNGDTAFTLIIDVFKHLINIQKDTEDALSLEEGSLDDAESNESKSILNFITNPVKLKQIFANALTNQKHTKLFDNLTVGTYILDTRNDIALLELKKQIELGNKKIAIYYGAAHLNDFEEKLIKDFNFKRTGLDWVEAWDLQRADSQGKSELVKMIQMASTIANLSRGLSTKEE